MRNYNRINNENDSSSDAMSDKVYYKSHEQIKEAQYNIFMKIFKGCKTNEKMYSSIIRAKDRTFNLERLIVQDFNIIEINGKKLSPGEKNYSFIPIDEDSAKNCLFYFDNNDINIQYFEQNIKSLMINNIEIEGFCKNSFEKNIRQKSPKK